MCNRVRASFEFREIKLRWDLINDLPQFKPIANNCRSEFMLLTGSQEDV